MQENSEKCPSQYPRVQREAETVQNPKILTLQWHKKREKQLILTVTLEKVRSENGWCFCLINDLNDSSIIKNSCRLISWQSSIQIIYEEFQF